MITLSILMRVIFFHCQLLNNYICVLTILYIIQLGAWSGIISWWNKALFSNTRNLGKCWDDFS